MNKEQIEVMGATEPFFTYKKDEITYYEFDSSLCTPPGPMVNAMCGLKLIDSPNKKLVMINMKMPMGLFPKIRDDFEWEEEQMEDGKIKLIFSRKDEGETSTNFDDNKCSG